MAWASITYPEHPSTLVAAVSTYYEQESYMDVSFMCAGLERVEAHRLVLTSVSPFMKTLLMEHCGPEPPVISLPDVSQHLLRLVLQFLYDGVMKVNQDELAEFKNILTVLGIKVPNATVVKLNERIPTKLNPSSKDLFVRRPPKRPSPVAQSRSPALVAVPPPTPSKVTDVDPSDDPLNVPDFYFRPQPSQPETTDATVSSAAASTATPVIEPDPMPMDDEEEEAAALEIPVSRSSVTLQTSSPTVPTVNTSRRSTRSSIKPATPQQQPPPSPEVLIKVEREDEDMNQSNSSLVNTSSQHTTLQKGVLDYSGEMERAQSDLWQGRHVTRRGCDNDDSIICLDDSDSGDGEAEASWFRNINITVEENLEKIKTLYEGCLEPSSPMPQTYTCEQMTVQRTYLGKSQTTCRRQGPNEGIEAEDNTLSNIGTKNVFTDTFTDEQMVILKWEFEENHFPPATRIKKLSERLRLPESKVEGWFIHKRREGSVTSSRGKSKKTDLNKRQLRRLKLNLTVEQINGLEHSFSQDPRPTVHQCGLLAQTLGVSQIDVARWFDNRHKNLKEQIGANVPAEFDETLISKHQLERLNQEFLKSPRLNPDGCGESSAKDPRLSEMSCKDTSNCEDINNRSGLFFYEINSKDSYNDDKINTSDVSKLGEMDDEASQGIYNVSNMCEIICEGFSNHSKINIVSCPNYNNLDNRNNPDICMKPKKKTATPRFFFSEKQVEYLNQEFSTNKTPSRTRIQDLSNRLCVSERRVRRWFKNRRHKDRISKPGKKESISAGQLRCLRVEFVKDCYAFQNRRERIALDLGLTQFKVDNWFKNMRKKMQKTNLNFGDHVARGQFVKQVVRGRKSRESIDHQTEYIDRQLDARGSVPDKEMNRLRDIERTVNSLGSNAGADGRVTPPDISEYLIPSISLCSSPETV